LSDLSDPSPLARLDLRLDLLTRTHRMKRKIRQLSTNLTEIVTDFYMSFGSMMGSIVVLGSR
jgi:hypothetical protein